jgi:dTDP-6-deoxy-L-talose 4-dehydrogenase (NAD+)
MRVLVSGATGFIGRHTVRALLQRGARVVALARRPEAARSEPWFDDVEFVAVDLAATESGFVQRIGRVDACLHLAWSGLPNYGSLTHFEECLPASYRFLKQLVVSQCPRLVVAGTCFEYGSVNGPLREDMPTNPSNPYGLAKDCLRRFLEALQSEIDFELTWARLFYLYGDGQDSKSLLPQLQLAIKSGAQSFAMSRGDQLRDFLPVESAAESLARLAELQVGAGIVNICSGQPISVRNFVENWLQSRGQGISLELGRYPYSKFEPMAFWGSNEKLKSLLSE